MEGKRVLAKNATAYGLKAFLDTLK